MLHRTGSVFCQRGGSRYATLKFDRIVDDRSSLQAEFDFCLPDVTGQPIIDTKRSNKQAHSGPQGIACDTIH